MSWSFEFLYTDLQNFWIFVFLGLLVDWLVVGFFFPCLLFHIAHIALFTLSLAMRTLFVLRYFK